MANEKTEPVEPPALPGGLDDAATFVLKHAGGPGSDPAKLARAGHASILVWYVERRDQQWSVRFQKAEAAVAPLADLFERECWAHAGETTAETALRILRLRGESVRQKTEEIASLTERLRKAEAERDHLKRREQDIIAATEPADGGQYRADIASAIQRQRADLDRAKAAILRLYTSDVLSEGQAAKILGIDRLTLRERADAVAEEVESPPYERCDVHGPPGYCDLDKRHQPDDRHSRKGIEWTEGDPS